MYKVKRFSKSRKESDENVSFDSKAMRDIGKAGLKTSAGLATGAGLYLATGAKDAVDLYKDMNDLKALPKDPNFRQAVKKEIESIPVVGKEAARKVKMAEKYVPEFNKLDKITKSARMINSASNMSRTALDNADRYTQMAVDAFKDKNRNLSPEVAEQLNRIPKSVRKGARLATKLKNAKLAGKAAAGLASGSGVLYMNGRMLEATERGIPKDRGDN